MTIDPATALDLYRVMRTIRRFEQRSTTLFGENKIWGTIHSYAGEEAIAAGVCAHLRDDDWITSTHRGHGHCIAKGADLGKMFAELLGRETGYCRGRGGSMPPSDPSKGTSGAQGHAGPSLFSGLHSSRCARCSACCHHGIRRLGGFWRWRRFTMGRPAPRRRGLAG